MVGCITGLHTSRVSREPGEPFTRDRPRVPAEQPLTSALVPLGEGIWYKEGQAMALILLILLLALLFGGLGFAVHALWIIAVVLFITWLIGFAVHSGEGSRWYRW
jgi:hypothetical protein